MRLTPNINNLDENLAYICSQEADDIARKSTQEKAGKNVFKVTEEEVGKDPTKAEFLVVPQTNISGLWLTKGHQWR